MQLKYGNGEIANGRENFCIVSKYKTYFDYIVVTDSRGGITSNLNSENSFIYNLKFFFDNVNKSHLIISRPKKLTVFATLINFLKSNFDLKFKYLITNIGFVDCTPKKRENINDILLQIEQFSQTDNFLIEHENYMLNNGNVVMLESVKYSKEYIEEISTFLGEKFEKCYFINTPIVSECLKIKRDRPKSFFTQLYKTNELIESIISSNQKNVLIDIKGLNHTYDGVHYTEEGHERVFFKIKEVIGL